MVGRGSVIGTVGGGCIGAAWLKSVGGTLARAWLIKLAHVWAGMVPPKTALTPRMLRSGVLSLLA
jgi:hypothetical protein